jgi:predicted GH43/DUF377 family glycosyl hydrolase
MSGNMTYDFTMRRLGLIMEPDMTRQAEMLGVLNPGVARGRDGKLYLFPRMVGPDNFSRTGQALVVFDDNGDPIGAERLRDDVLVPTREYETHDGTGGCEDPRITLFQPFDTYALVYAAWGPSGPRVAIAHSKDLRTWTRDGRVDFKIDPNPVYNTNFDVYHNKDGMIFPEAVPGPDGRPSLALLHRPVYETAPNTTHDIPPGITDPMPSIWMSFCALEDLKDGFHGRLPLHHHHCLADPEQPWEALRIGGGAPPIRTKHGWLLIYHGVSGELAPMLSDQAPTEMTKAAAEGPRPVERKQVVYRAGAMLLDFADPRRILYRTKDPILEPEGGKETAGIVSNVVFPTGLDVRTDIHQPHRVDVYYGMADSRIGAATFNLPE